MYLLYYTHINNASYTHINIIMTHKCTYCQYHNSSHINATICYMSKKHITARKAYWNKIPVETRKEKMRALALKRYQNISQKKRIKIGQTLLNGRKKSAYFSFTNTKHNKTKNEVL